MRLKETREILVTMFHGRKAVFPIGIGSYMYVWDASDLDVFWRGIARSRAAPLGPR